MKIADPPPFRGNDPTALGRILVAMGAASLEQLAAAMQAQKNGQSGALGTWMVKLGIVSPAQLEAALAVQVDLRSGSKHKRALAQARIAQAGGAAVRRLARVVKRRSAEVKRKTTGRGYPAVPRPVTGEVDPP